MKKMWIFVDYIFNTKAVFDSYEKLESFRKHWLYAAIYFYDWDIEKGKGWDAYEITLNPKNLNEFYEEEI